MATSRAILLGMTAAVAGGTFGAVCGVILCLADGLAWEYAGGWGLRGALGGLVAGAIMGAMSGFYHVDELASDRAPPEARKPTVPVVASAPARPVVALRRNGVRPKT